MTSRALVTGSTGFVGGVLTRRLVQDGWEVHCIVRRTSSPEAVAGLSSCCRVHTHDGSTKQLLSIVEQAVPDVVFHLASLFLAEHRPEDVENLVRSNVLFSTQLAEAMVSSGCKRMVNTGTSWQHYDTSDYRPVNLYAATKQAFEDILVYYHDVHDLSVVTLKLFDTYGPGDRRRRLVDILVDAAMSGERIDMSPGQQIVDLTHVDDVVRALLVAAGMLVSCPTPVRRDYLLSGERLSVRRLVEVTGSVLGRPLNVNLGGRPYRSREVMAPVVGSTEALKDWKRQISVRDYLRGISQDAKPPTARE